MNKIIVITHGHLAHGIQDTVSMFVPETSNIFYLSFDGTNLELFNEQLTKLIDNKQNTIVLCDIYGGTPFITACKQIISNNIRVVSGVNLAMIIEAIINQSNDDIDKVVELICNASRESIMCYIQEENSENTIGENDGI